MTSEPLMVALLDHLTSSRTTHIYHHLYIHTMYKYVEGKMGGACEDSMCLRIFFIPPQTKFFGRYIVIHMSVRLFVRLSVPPNLKSATLLRPLNRISWNFQELFTTWCHTAPPILKFYSNDFGVSKSIVSIAYSISSFEFTLLQISRTRTCSSFALLTFLLISSVFSVGFTSPWIPPWQM